MTIFSAIQKASLPLLVCLMGMPALANEPGGLLTGSFGDEPLELHVAPELSGVTIIANYSDISVFAAQVDGDQGPVNLSLEINGELPTPDGISLTLVRARDMGQNWTGNQDSLKLALGELETVNGIVSVKGTVTGQVTGGPQSESRPIAISFDTRLEELD